MPTKNITVTRRLSLPVGHHFLLFLLFLGLRLGGVIDWHWFWVFVPLILKISLLGAMFCRTVLKRVIEDDDDEEDEEGGDDDGMEL